MTLREKIALWILVCDFMFRAIKYGPYEVKAIIKRFKL